MCAEIPAGVKRRKRKAMKNRKWITPVVTVLIMIVIVVGAITGRFKFTLNDDGQSYSVASGIDLLMVLNVEIPDIYKGLPVTSIGEEAFRGCVFLTSIEIPDSIISIPYRAFCSCHSLTNITIPDSVTIIGEEAFDNCESLTSIEIPDSVTSIGGLAFDGCSSLTSITIPDSVTSIGDYAFRGCSSLTSIEIPDSVTSIGAKAFDNCESLTSVVIPDSVTSIGSGAFSYCTSLTSIEVDIENKYYKSIDENLYTIDGKELVQYAVGKTDTSFTIPNYVTSIDGRAFVGCHSLTSVVIPDSVTSIDGTAFYSCYSLIEVCNKSSLDIAAGRSNYGYVDKYVKHIITDESETYLRYVGDYVFYDDGTDIYLVKYTGNETNLTLPEYDGGKQYKIHDYAFYDNAKITKVIIPDSVTSIGDYVFYKCSSLASISIGDSVTSIGECAFLGSTSLIIYCEAKSKPSGWSSDWNSNKRLVVWGYKGN